MGASLSWYAVRGRTPERVLRDFGLKPAGPENHGAPFCGGMLPGGWFLLHRGRHEFTLDELRKLSDGGEAIACFVEEHVMVSRAAGGKDGKLLWCITHDSQEGRDHLEIEGAPPAALAAIRDRLTKQQQGVEGVDYIFDIPVDLAAAITGYDHENTEMNFDYFVKAGLFQRWFGS